MKFNLSQILKSNLLLEGRKEDTLKKYGEEHSDLINLLSNVDPSGNNKYLGWMVKTALGFNKDENIPTADNVARVVNDFHRNIQRIKNKDINSYKTIVDLKTVVDEALEAEKDVRVSKEAAKVYEDDEVVIMAPFTVEASCKYGSGSKWCIAGTSGHNDLNPHFDDYSKHSNFYFFIRKNVSKQQDPVGYKYALQVRFDRGGSENTWWNAQDNSSRNIPSFVTNKMLAAVSAYDPTHTKKKLDTQIKSFIKSPKIKDYNKFKQHITDEQKVSVINKIISSTDLSNNVFTVLVEDLTDEQKNNFIENYVKGSVTTSDYEKMKDHLSVKQKERLIINNPSILNNFKIMGDLNDNIFNDEIKYIITKNIDSKLINNTDSKVLLKKWSMTEEERSKHNETSFYVFLNSNDLDFDGELKLDGSIVKVDPLDPNSYRTINMMKLRKQVQKDMKMYGIKTKQGLLDEFIDNKSNEVPSSIWDIIKEKSIEIG